MCVRERGRERAGAPPPDGAFAASRPESGTLPPWGQPRGKWMISFVNSHTNATSKRWHLWEIDYTFALKRRGSRSGRWSLTRGRARLGTWQGSRARGAEYNRCLGLQGYRDQARPRASVHRLPLPLAPPRHTIQRKMAPIKRLQSFRRKLPAPRPTPRPLHPPPALPRRPLPCAPASPDARVTPNPKPKPYTLKPKP